MKQVFWLTMLCAFLMACQSQEGVGPQSLTQSASSDAVATALVDAGELRIVEFREDGDDETDEFAGYRFDFRSDGKVIATRSDGSVEGSYSVFRDDGKTELSMRFPRVGEFYELSDDWYFVSQENGRFFFEDRPDVLTFQID